MDPVAQAKIGRILYAHQRPNAIRGRFGTKHSANIPPPPDPSPHTLRLEDQRNTLIERLNNFFARQSPASLALIISLMMIGIGVVDYVSGFDLSTGLFYIAPISIASWYLGRRAGLATALISAGTWLVVNALVAPPHIRMAINLWNMFIRLGFFSIISALLSSLRESFETHRQLARTDALTGLLNSRTFREQALIELSRAQRYQQPLALLYLDLDNFKSLNDDRGYAVGDALLRDIGQALQSSLRTIDLVGRLGGDEFAILLANTQPPDALTTAHRLQTAVAVASRRTDSLVGVTIGVVLSDGSASIETLINQADHAMYAGKSAARGSINLAPQPFAKAPS